MDYKKLFESKEAQKLSKIICEIAKECWNLKLSDSTGFSISAKIPESDAIIVDRSGTGFRRNKIEPGDLILINIDGELLYNPGGINNDRLAPVNVEVHLAGYKASKSLNGCVHWHDEIINAFSGKELNIEPYTLQSKLLGTVECIKIDDREEKDKYFKSGKKIEVPSAFHLRDDVYYAMSKVADEANRIIAKRSNELEKHGIVVTHKEHGLFAWGRTIDEAFENAYRARRNAESILWSKILDDK